MSTIGSYLLSTWVSPHIFKCYAGLEGRDKQDWNSKCAAATFSLVQPVLAPEPGPSSSPLLAYLQAALNRHILPTRAWSTRCVAQASTNAASFVVEQSCAARWAPRLCFYVVTQSRVVSL